MCDSHTNPGSACVNPCGSLTACFELELSYHGANQQDYRTNQASYPAQAIPVITSQRIGMTRSSFGPTKAAPKAVRCASGRHTRK